MAMLIIGSLYSIVDGLFVSNYAGKTAFAAINLVMPFIMVLGGIGFMVVLDVLRCRGRFRKLTLHSKVVLTTTAVLILGGAPSMISQFEAAGFTSCEDTPEDVPDIVVAAFDMTLTYKRLCRAAWWISRGLPYIATNPDRVCPTNEETVLVDCGSICRCLESATGRKPDITLGKPDPNMLIGIQQQRGLKPEEILMVGDRIYTDIAMAFNAGAMGCLVLSGETTMEVAQAAERQPDLIVDSIEVLGNMLQKIHDR